MSKGRVLLAFTMWCSCLVHAAEAIYEQLPRVHGDDSDEDRKLVRRARKDSSAEHMEIDAGGDLAAQPGHASAPENQEIMLARIRVLEAENAKLKKHMGNSLEKQTEKDKDDKQDDHDQEDDVPEFVKVTSGECEIGSNVLYMVIESENDCKQALGNQWPDDGEKDVLTIDKPSFAAGCFRYDIPPRVLWVWNTIFQTSGWRTDSGRCTGDPGYAACVCEKNKQYTPPTTTTTTTTTTTAHVIWWVD